MTKRVYVDAKIEGIQDPKLNRKAYVAYVVKDAPGLQGFGKVDAYETDDAELHAIAFAIQQLKDKLKRFIVFFRPRTCSVANTPQRQKRWEEATDPTRDSERARVKFLDQSRTIRQESSTQGPQQVRCRTKYFERIALLH